MPVIEIKHRWSGAVLWTGEAANLREAAERAVASRADLTRANLIRANLTGADLSGADLTRADLTGADLSGADLSEANLSEANLSGANLIRANLIRANLSGADLTRANLTRADLTRANLTRADLTGADLSGADLSEANLSGTPFGPIKGDLWDILAKARPEVLGLLAKLRSGEIDGSTYGDTGCRCLVGTIAMERHCALDQLVGITPNSSRPAERWFLAIRPGDTPKNSVIAKLTEGWILEFCDIAGIAAEVSE